MFPAVVKAFEQAQMLRPDAAEPLSELGLTYAMAWQWTKAWEYLDAARQKDRNLASTELGLAVYYSGLGEAARVKESLNRARRSTRSMSKSRTGEIGRCSSSGRIPRRGHGATT